MSNRRRRRTPAAGNEVTVTWGAKGRLEFTRAAFAVTAALATRV